MELKKKTANFDVKRAASWGKFERVPFMFMAKALESIVIESNTTVITEILCNMLRTVIETTPGELVAVVYLLSERIEPQPVSINRYFLRSAMEYAQNRLKALSGLPVNAKESSLTVVEVYETFKELTKSHPLGEPTEFRTDLIKGLINAATLCELLILIRLLGRMDKMNLYHMLKIPLEELPLKEQTLLTALGHAALYSMNLYSPSAINPELLEDAAKVVRKVYSAVPNYDKLVPDLLLSGVWKLSKKCTITPGIPFRPMRPSGFTISLSHICNKLQDKNLICEYSYPGEHAFIHYTDENEKSLLEVYDLHGSRITNKYLDVARAAVRLKQPSAVSFILECYLVKYGGEEQRVNSKFLSLIHEIPDRIWPNIIDVEQFCIYAFDILYLNGEQLLQEPLKVRRKYLQQSFVEEDGVLQFAAIAFTPKIPANLQFVLNEAVSLGCLRLRIKTENSTYEPDSDSQNMWESGTDFEYYIPPPILDLVPIAAHRDNKGDYTYLLACYDSDKDIFQAIGTMGSVGRGLEELLDSLKVIDNPKDNYKSPEKVHPTTVWYDPTEVWEVEVILELSDSPMSAAFGKWDENKGIVLSKSKFLRVLADKDIKQASSPDEVVELYGELLSFEAYKRRKSTTFHPPRRS